jgi:hypothetical protein
VAFTNLSGLSSTWSTAKPSLRVIDNPSHNAHVLYAYFAGYMSRSVQNFTSEELEKIRSIVFSVYQTVWDEFHAFEYTSSEQYLRGLAGQKKKTHVKHNYCFGLNEVGNYTSNTALSLDGRGVPDEDEVFTVYSFSESSDLPVFSSTLQVISCPRLEDFFIPLPTYESTQAIPRNIHHGDDPDALPFIPFADDTNFNYRNYVQDHKSLLWQSNPRSPDGMFADTDIEESNSNCF